MLNPAMPGMPDLSQAEEYTCDRCGYPFFQTVVMVKKLSPLASPNGQTMLIPQPVFKCDDCGFIGRTQFGLPKEEGPTTK